MNSSDRPHTAMKLRLLQILFFSLSNVWAVELEPSARNQSGVFTNDTRAGVRSFPTVVLQVQTRIIGGVEACDHSWPWQVSLKAISIFACGGAVVSSQWVISAAHCFKRYNKASYWVVMAGKHDLDNMKENGQQEVAVSSIITHKGYNTRTKECDVALLQLSKPLIFNEFVRPIHIWMHKLPVMSECTATGWGSTRENGPRVTRLQEVNVTIISSEVCKRYYGGRIRDTMFCAGKEEGGADACQGDSGGPLSCFTGIRYELAGVVSWGVGCGRAKKPGVYTKAQNFVSWMADIMTSHENKTLDDSKDVKEAGDNCGQQQDTNCAKVPLIATLSQSQDGTVSIQNISESCPYYWPWQVSIQRKGNHICSGTLIHQRFVLTAKHCHVRPKDIVVWGVHDLQISFQFQRIPIDEVINLADDDSFPLGSDLSLLRLSICAKGRNAAPVCVPDQDDDDDLDPSWTCVVTGWGASALTGDINGRCLHHVAVTLANETLCREKWSEDLIKESHICAHPAASTSCLGDAGAPLFCRKHEAYILFGLVTWGSSHCDGDYPAIFTRVSYFYSWILATIESKDFNICP